MNEPKLSHRVVRPNIYLPPYLPPYLPTYLSTYLELIPQSLEFNRLGQTFR